MAEKLAFTIKSDTAQDREAQRVSVEHQILTAARNHGFDGQPLFAIKLALDEALVNAIKHGNRGDLAKHVLVEVNVLPGRLEVFIEDEGPGFDRSSVPDPTAEENLEKCSGRGILLMESYMTSVEWDHGGRRVRLVKEK